MSDLIARLLSCTASSESEQDRDCYAAAKEIERLTAERNEAIKAGANEVSCRIELQARAEELEGGINRAAVLALQKASHELIRQVLAEALAATEQGESE